MSSKHPILTRVGYILGDIVISLVVWNIALPWVDSRGYVLLTIAMYLLIVYMVLGIVIHLLDIGMHWHGVVSEPWREA